LDHFIAYALHRTRLHQSVTFAALYLLQRLKARFLAAKGSSGHRLFISAFMLASKIICDDTYSNKSWCIVGQGMFALREINQMEREMCSYLEWQLNVDPTTLRDFESRVRHDFASLGPYRTPSVGAGAVRSSEHESQHQLELEFFNSVFHNSSFRFEACPTDCSEPCDPIPFLAA
jgi:hypothetical protein